MLASDITGGDKEHRNNSAIVHRLVNVLPIYLIKQKFQTSAIMSSSGAGAMWHSNLPLLRQSV